MSIRYSGDTEIRITWDPNRYAYRATVRDPYLRWSGFHPGKKGRLKTPEDYDRAAKSAFRSAAAWAKRQGKIFRAEYGFLKGVVLRRGFQSPCPLN